MVYNIPPTNTLINYSRIASTLSPQVLQAAIRLSNLNCKLVQFTRHLFFLNTSLSQKAVPLYITSKRNSQGYNSRAVLRKQHTLCMEILRQDIHTAHVKLYEINRERSYEWFNVIRSRSHQETINPLLANMDETMRKEEDLIYHRHSNKWYNRHSQQYPSASYVGSSSVEPPLPYKTAPTDRQQTHCQYRFPHSDAMQHTTIDSGRLTVAKQLAAGFF